MGFGDIIEFPIFEIPTKLAFYVVDILNTKNMTLECPMGDIKITPKAVKQVLGLPMGRRRLEREGHREYNDPFLLQWKDHCENSSTANFIVLKNVFEGDDVSDIDWCSGNKDDQETKTSKKTKETRPTTLLNVKFRKKEETRTKTLLNVVKKKDEQETGTSKKDEADNNKEEGMANKKATNQKINEEIDPFDYPKFGEYYIQNEHLFVPTQTSAEKKKDQTDDVNWDSFLENEEEIIRKGREFSAEIRKKAQQQERERKRKGKKEKGQI
ncbi:hypothetical protein Tco_1287235 [Tanacetum coccineum]